MLVKKNEEERKWYPTPIKSLGKFLTKVIYQGEGFVHVMALRQNISYNIQYLQFIDRVLSDIKLSSVLKTQNIKIYVVVGCSIVESLLTYLLIKTNNQKTTQWEKVADMPGQQKKIDGQFSRIDTTLFKKLETAKDVQMTFDAMLKRAEANDIFGGNHEIYEKLNHLRKLRNKVHLQAIDDPNDTDWNTFNERHMRDMSMVLNEIFMSEVFEPSDEEKEYFSFLAKHME